MSTDESLWLDQHPYQADNVAVDLRYARSVCALKRDDLATQAWVRVESVASMLFYQWNAAICTASLQTVQDALGVYATLQAWKSMGLMSTHRKRLSALAVLLDSKRDRCDRMQALGALAGCISPLMEARELRRLGRFSDAVRLLALVEPAKLGPADKTLVDNIGLYTDVPIGPKSATVTPS